MIFQIVKKIKNINKKKVKKVKVESIYDNYQLASNHESTLFYNNMSLGKNNKVLEVEGDNNSDDDR